MCCCRIFLTAFVIVQFVAAVLAILGTPFDVYRPRDTDYDSDTACITLWGAKKKCFSGSVDVKTDDLWKGCSPRLDRFRAAEAMSIITIVLFTLSFILALIQCCCCGCCKFLCAVLNFLGVITGIVVFAIPLDSWNTRRGPEVDPLCMPVKKMLGVDGKSFFKIGSSVALYIVAVCLAFINIIFALLPC